MQLYIIAGSYIYNSNDVNCLNSKYSNGYEAKEEAILISYISKYARKHE